MRARDQVNKLKQVSGETHTDPAPFDSMITNMQIQTIAGLIYPCIYFKRKFGGQEIYNDPMTPFEKDDPTYTPPLKEHECGLCTIILSRYRIEVDKLATMAKDVDLHVFTGSRSKFLQRYRGEFMYTMWTD